VSGRKKTEATVPIAVRLTKSVCADLDAAKKVHHQSRSKLIQMAVARCLQDGIWHRTPAGPGVASDPVSPPPEVATLSQALMGVAMTLDAVCASRKRPSKELQEAAVILADARTLLSQVLEDLGCF
jgi:hypothetical protein